MSWPAPTHYRNGTPINKENTTMTIEPRYIDSSNLIDALKDEDFVPSERREVVQHLNRTLEGFGRIRFEQEEATTYDLSAEVKVTFTFDVTADNVDLGDTSPDTIDDWNILDLISEALGYHSPENMLDRRAEEQMFDDFEVVDYNVTESE